MRLSVMAILAARLAAGQELDYHDPGLKNIVQVAIVTQDIAAASQRWAALLGVPPPAITTTRPGSEVRVVYRGRPSNGRAKLAFFRTGPAVLELIEPVGGDTSWKEGLDRHGESVHHVAFQVQDLERTVRAFEKAGYPVIHRGRYDKDNGTYVYLDTEKQLGVTIELLHSDPK